MIREAAELPVAEPDVRAFIETNLRLTPAPSLPEIVLYAAHPGSRLGRLSGSDADLGPPPYWAYPWAGGTALARYFLDRPQCVAGRRVLDLGAGSGVVAIAAAIAGASQVFAAEIDRNALVALALNAAANRVEVEATGDDILEGLAPAVDLLAVGDLFYDPELARRAMSFLDRCAAAGVEILVGDPGRAYLPRSRLRPLADYRVADFGDSRAGARTSSHVFAFRPA